MAGGTIFGSITTGLVKAFILVSTVSLVATGFVSIIGGSLIYSTNDRITIQRNEIDALLPPVIYNGTQCFPQGCVNKFGGVLEWYADEDMSMANRSLVLYESDPQLPKGKVLKNGEGTVFVVTNTTLQYDLSLINSNSFQYTFGTFYVGKDGRVSNYTLGPSPIFSFMGRTNSNATIMAGDVQADQVSYQLTNVEVILDIIMAARLLTTTPVPGLPESRSILFSTSFVTSEGLSDFSIDLKDVTVPGLCEYPSSVVRNSKGQIVDCTSGPIPGDPNGLATLDAEGKLSYPQIPDILFTGLQYQGVWNAANNTPTLLSSDNCTIGYYYMVQVAGNTTLNGYTNWQVGYGVLCSGHQWVQIPLQVVRAVDSWNGRVGTVVVEFGDVTSSLVSHAGLPLTYTLNATFWVSTPNAGIPNAVVPSVVANELTLNGAQFGLPQKFGSMQTFQQPTVFVFDQQGRLTSGIATNYSADNIIFGGSLLSVLLQAGFILSSSQPGLPGSSLLTAGPGIQVSGSTVSLPTRFLGGSLLQWNQQAYVTPEGVVYNISSDNPQASQISYNTVTVANALDAIITSINFLNGSTAELPMELALFNASIQANRADINILLANVADLYARVNSLNLTSINTTARVGLLEQSQSAQDVLISGLITNVTALQISQAAQDLLIAGLIANVTSLQSLVSSQAQTISIIQSTLIGIQSNITSIQAGQVVQNSLITGLQTNVTSLQSSYTTILSQLLQMNSTVISHSAALTSQFIVGTATPNLANELVLQGTANQISVLITSGLITLSTPQNLDTAAAVLFANATLSSFLKLQSGGTTINIGGPTTPGSSYNFRMPNTQGTAGQVIALSNPTTGDTTWTTPSTASAGSNVKFSSTSQPTYSISSGTFTISPTGVGSLTFAANELSTSTVLRVYLAGTMISSVSSQISLSIRYNGVTIMTDTTQALTTNSPFVWTAYVNLLNTGGSATCATSGFFFPIYYYSVMNNNNAVCPTNVAVTLSFVGKFVNAGTNSLQVGHLIVEKLVLG